MRTIGIEEELLLVDPSTGCPAPVGRRVAAATSPLAVGYETAALTTALQQEMISVATSQQYTLENLARSLTQGRRLADEAAVSVGARAVALAASPVACVPHVTETERNDAMVRRYGQTARNSLACGMRVHVSIESAEEGVQILDRIRPWLATLVALSTNSSIVGGVDTGHASDRTLDRYRWPCAGPSDIFGSLEAYLRHEDSLLDSGVLLDSGMLSFDARLSHRHPTMEIRVADVVADRNHAIAIAALGRALVETSARQADLGVPPSDIPSALLRLASWQSAASGVQGMLVDPETRRPQTAHAVVAALLQHVRDALDDDGDLEFVEETLDDILAYGTGADHQRFVFAAMGDAAAVVSAALAKTHDNLLVLTRQRS